MKKKFVFFILLLLSCFCYSKKSDLNFSKLRDFNFVQPETNISYTQENIDGEIVSFTEVWGYVLKNNEHQFSNEMPITDLCYFSADINTYGELEKIPNPKNFDFFTGRKHLVVTCSSYSLSHFVLSPEYDIQKKIINTLVKASKHYDGIQIDFETIPKNDLKNYRNFLKKLKSKLPNDKIFSVCVPARIKTLNNDIFDYSEIAKIADKIIIMAYDQHWSTSEPGPIAGMDWCNQILQYAKTIIPQEKLIMGLPFYGRSWQDESFGKAWINTRVNKIISENNIKEINRQEGVPYCKFKKEIQVELWFDDEYSLTKRCQMYESANVSNIAFWRIGQEDFNFWKHLQIKQKEEN